MVLMVRDLRRAFGHHTVLEGVTFSLQPGERLGIVGLNGAGKTTLLRLIAGRDQPDGGTIQRPPEMTLGLLAQRLPDDGGRTVGDALDAGVGDLRAIERHMRDLEALLASVCGDALEALVAAYGELAAAFLARGGYDLEAREAAVLHGLGLGDVDRGRSLATLSGGEAARVGLAALLLGAPDLLLLDEPTNHLDAAALAWLEGCLANYRGAALIVAHDRQFLNRAVTRIGEIDEYTHGLTLYPGDYDVYRAAKDAERARWAERYDRQQAEIAALRQRLHANRERSQRHHEPPKDGNKLSFNAHGERAQDAIGSGIRAAEERLARLEADPVPKPPKPLRFRPRFDAEALRSDAVIQATGLGRRHGDRWLFRGVSFAVPPTARIVLSGPNGVGKTTLVRLVLGLEAPDDGTVRVAGAAQIGYLAQAVDLGDPDQTALDAMLAGTALTPSQGTAALVGSGLLRIDDLARRVAHLSLGQRRKIAIARLIAAAPNVLILDEPTNYLSLDVLEAFERAVIAFPGPVIAVSHDRWFIRRFGGVVWELTAGGVARRAE